MEHYLLFHQELRSDLVDLEAPIKKKKKTECKAIKAMTDSPLPLFRCLFKLFNKQQPLENRKVQRERGAELGEPVYRLLSWQLHCNMTQFKIVLQVWLFLLECREL